MDKMDKTEMSAVAIYARCKILNLAVTHICKENGYDSMSKSCLETMVEMFQAFLIEIGRASTKYCELAGRVKPLNGDIIIALANMGLPLNGIVTFSKRVGRPVIPLPSPAAPQKSLNLLQAGTKSKHPSHIPSFLPALPDPHAYVRTPTHKQPVTEYEAIREKAANQKKDVEKALTKFLSKTSETHSLFETEDNMFPLIACKPSFPSYLAALNPTDQVFDFEELEYHYLVANRTEDITSKDDVDDNDSANDEDAEDGETKADRIEKEAKPFKIKPNSTTNKAILENPNIDNPYLRAATLPKRGRSSQDAFPAVT